MVVITAEELALLGLAPGEPLPGNGQTLEVSVLSGTGTASLYFHRLYIDCFPVALHPGTLNLLAAEDFAWPNPMTCRGRHFCPIVLQERAIGVAMRHANPALRAAKFIEVLSPVELRPRLDHVKDGERIQVRLLSGDLLQ